MVDRELVTRRVVAQELVGARRTGAADVARAFLATQGQDLTGAVSSLALRLALPPGAAVAEVERAFADGEIVRGYPMRGTVFITAAEDLRWLTQLCAPAEIRGSAMRREKHLGIEESTMHSARAVLEEVTGERGIPRSELLAHWTERGIATEQAHRYHILKHFLMTDIAVYGPLAGRENLVVAGDRWLPVGSSLQERFGGDRTQAAAELLRRYLTSRGPASVRDAAWFSKLPIALLTAALQQLGDEVVPAGPDARGEMRYERPSLQAEWEQHGGAALKGILLPPFDEIVLGYPDRLALMTPAAHEVLVPGNRGVFLGGFLRRGEIIARWRRAGTAARPRLELAALEDHRRLPNIAVAEADSRFRAFPVYPPR